MDDFIASLPKAELHVHLEGTVEPDLLWQLAQRYQTSLVEQGREAVDELYRPGDFSRFLHAFKTVCQHLRAPDDYEAITYAALKKMAAQNIRYAEITISAGVMLWKGEDLADSFSGIEAGANRAQGEFGIRVAWIFDSVRQFGPDAALAVLQEALRFRYRRVIGFGIGGDERKAAADQFRTVFETARSEGLRIAVHAGEAAGPESVWSALQALGAERIGHGLTAIQDEGLVEYLAVRQLPLEICLSSNFRTGCLEDLSQHPLRRYFDQGVLVCLNTDDPALFQTDLNREYQLARDLFGFSDSELTEIARSSFRAAFLPPGEIASYLAAFDIVAKT